MRIDHYGIVVRSIFRAREQMLSPLFPVGSWSEIIHEPLQRVNVCFLSLPGGKLELIEPVGDDSPVAEFARKKPAGYHHVCLEVPDMLRSIEECKRAGMVIVSQPKPSVAFGGRDIAFVVSRDGLLWELLSDA